MKSKIIEIKEKVQIGDTILEKGNRIRVSEAGLHKNMIEKEKIQEAEDTAKCPECGTDYLVATGYCVKCKKKVKDIKKKEEAIIEEAVDIDKVIKDLQGNFSGSNEEQMKATQLLKGLATSDDPKSNEFMKKLDVATTKISKEVLGTEDKKEEKTEVIEEKIDKDFEDFIDIAKSGSAEDSFKKVQMIKDVPFEVSQKFFAKYNPNSNKTPKEAWTDFVKSVKEELNIEEKIDITEESKIEEPKSFFEIEENISFEEYLERTSSLEEERAVSSTNTSGEVETSFDNSHRHTYKVDGAGNGATIITIPNEFPTPHIHPISDWKVGDVENHIHTVYEGARGAIS